MPLLHDAINAYLSPLLKKHSVGGLLTIDDLNASMSIPKTLGGLGIENPDIDLIVAGALKDPSTGGNPIEMTPENTRRLLHEII